MLGQRFRIVGAPRRIERDATPTGRYRPQQAFTLLTHQSNNICIARASGRIDLDQLQTKTRTQATGVINKPLTDPGRHTPTDRNQFQLHSFNRLPGFLLRFSAAIPDGHSTNLRYRKNSVSRAASGALSGHRSPARPTHHCSRLRHRSA